MHFILTALGSSGDVHPMVGIGRRLRSRGHRVTIVTSPYFGELVERAGLELAPIGDPDELRTLMDDPDLWHPTRGPKTVLSAIGPLLPEVYEAVASRYVAGETVVGAHPIDFASRIAQEKLGVPLASLQLAPVMFRSVYAPPHLPPMLTAPWVPGWMIRAQYWLADRLIADRLLDPVLGPMRRDAGLPPVRRYFDRWLHSPQRVIGLFPEWFAPPQPDWPPNTVLTGFPLWDEGELGALPDDVARFLDDGTAPIAFTPGSAMVHGREFFAAAADACRRLGRRGVLLTRYPEQLPAVLPEGVVHFDFVPFGQLLPRSAALVHHGGIGSSAQPLAAGVPHLVMPMSHDQHDNASRLIRLGVAEVVPPKKFRGTAVAAALGRLLDSADVAARCRKIARRFEGVDAIDQTCDLLEALGT